MKIVKAHLKNFRKHVDREFNFTDGINVVRSENEGGKSTLFEAIAYALFGSSALITSLENAVTWGEDLKSLKVTIEVQSRGAYYTVTRSVGGAEILKDGEVFVTGQTAVSTWAAENLVGADAKMASKLMLATQGNLRGALESGPTALSEMIETLVDMDVFDRILEAAQSKLTLGPTTDAERRIKESGEKLEKLKAESIAQPDETEHQRAKDQMLDLLEATAASTNLARDQLEAVKVQRVELENRDQSYKKAVDEATKAHASMVRLQTTADELQVKASKSLADVAAAQALVNDALNRDRTLAAFNKFNQLPVVSFTRAEDYTETDMRSDVATLKSTVDALAVKHNSIKMLQVQEKAKIITHTTCDKCGQDVTHLESIKATNEAAEAKLVELDASLTLVSQELQAAKSQLVTLETNLAEVSNFHRQAGEISQYVTITGFPPVAVWAGSAVTSEPIDLASAQRQLKECREYNAAIASAQAQLELVNRQWEEARDDYDTFKHTLAGLKPVDPTEFIAIDNQIAILSDRWSQLNRETYDIHAQINQLQTEFDSAKLIYEMQQRMVSEASVQLDIAKAELEAHEFNNDLVKTVKALRPVIANRMWNTLLTVASVAYSQLRGEESVITKDKDGFKVNGRPSGAYSGSAKDMLGLALRYALVRTFLPECGLLVLDEPGQGCSKARTEVMLGFLSSTGFTQTLLVTHDDTAESIAANLIQF